jgi:ligand-binding SRPBCC domain-containing protein
MNYQHKFQVQASIQRVSEFHSRAASMAAITPPPIIVKIHSAPTVLGDGDQMSFTMWLGPLPVRWVAKIEDAPPNGFRDRQVDGPFAEWVHTHRFAVVDENTTDVYDEISLRLRKHLFWGAVGLAMRLGLPVLFAFRAWKTKRLLA